MFFNISTKLSETQVYNKISSMVSIYCGSYRFVKFHSLDNDTLFCKGTTKFADLQILSRKVLIIA